MIEYQKAIEHRMQSSSHMKPRQEVRTFWTGPSLSYYEDLSLRSAVASGARVLLYTYNKNLTVPEGFELADAREVLFGPLYQFHQMTATFRLRCTPTCSDTSPSRNSVAGIWTSTSS